MEEQPQFSPNGQRFAVVKASEAEPVDDAIAIYSTASAPPTLAWNYPQPNEYALFNFIGWEGEDRLRLSVYMRLNPDADPSDHDAEVVRTPQGWRLNRP